ncbi:MAG: hypothetical protein ACKV2V_29030 [Blastocatellia bacterium]
MKHSVRTLLSGLIDYAGLFPPASLDMRTAALNYGEYLKSDEAWILGRFIVPVSRLEEFEDATADLLPTGNPVLPWKLSALINPETKSDPDEDLNLIADFNYVHAVDELAGAAVVDTLEMPIRAVEDIRQARRALPRTMACYLEVPAGRRTYEMISSTARSGAMVKVRTGGVREDTIPTSAELAQFIKTCAGERVAFKATAGMHHALRGKHPLTYEANSPAGNMHGFLNVFLAACFARFGMEETDVRALLEETSIDAFGFEDEVITWRSHELTESRIYVARQQFAMSYGSCSFDEPIAELKSLGLI